MNRPTLMIGDVVRLSKRGKIVYAKHKGLFDKMVVQDIQGDSSDGRCKIVCTYFFGGSASKGIFARKHLWSTGYNVINKSSSKRPTNQPTILMNNNGRTHCAKCGQSTRLIMGLVRSYDVCQNQGCVWYQN